MKTRSYRKYTFLLFAFSGVAAATFAATPASPQTAPSTNPVDELANQTPAASTPATGRGGTRQPDCFIVSRTDETKYKVEGNIKIGDKAAQLVDMMYPKDMVKNDKSGKKYPGVIMFHGGGWIRTSKSTMSTFYNRYLAHGFVVCNAEYRLADKTGQFTPEFTPAPGAIQDALKAAKWFYDHADEYNVDKDRIVVTGASAGGHVALMVGLCTDEKVGPIAGKDFKIAAIVNGYGCVDVPALLAKQRPGDFASQWLPQGATRDEIAKQMSPMTYVRKDIPPLITVQGSGDSTHPVADSQRFTAALKAAGADAEIHLVNGAGHGFTPATWPDAEKATFDWLIQHKIIPAQ
jgi:acetyl esterase/lipase